MKKLTALALLTALMGASAQTTTTQPQTAPNQPANQAQPTQAQPAQTQQAGASVLQIAQERSNLSTFVQLAARAGLTETLARGGNFVVFAPSNNAFALLPTTTRERLLNDPQLLREVLSNHIVTGGPSPQAWTGNLEARSVAGQPLALRRVGNTARVNNAIVSQAFAAGNGTLYVIDRVLLPGSQLAARAAPITPQASTVPPQGQAAQTQTTQAQSTQTQPAQTQATAPAAGATGAGAAAQTPAPSQQATTPAQQAAGTQNVAPITARTVMQLLQSNPQFSVLVAALERTGLDSTLTATGTGSFTIFAPTNDAFAKIPREQLNAILDNERALNNLLSYHVVARALTAEELSRVSSVPSAGGDPIALRSQGGQLTVNGARVLQSDVRGSNGIIHVIDTVLAPNPGR